MAITKELGISSLTTASQDGIPFFSFLDTQILNGNIKEIHAVLNDNNRNPEVLADMARRAFGAVIKPEQIQVTEYAPDKLDELFAREFGFKIFPVAYAALSKEGVEAWIAPALIPVEHPLYHKTEGDNSVHVISGKAGDQDEKSLSYYVRLRVQERAGVLAQVSQEFANTKISIREMRQPEAEKGNSKVDMAFLSWPCQAKDLQLALKAITGLKDVVNVSTPLRAFNKAR